MAVELEVGKIYRKTRWDWAEDGVRCTSITLMGDEYHARFEVDGRDIYISDDDDWVEETPLHRAITEMVNLSSRLRKDRPADADIAWDVAEELIKIAVP